VLLHGPPGTGKTLIARNLARCSGMDYAIMSGGDVAPLGEDAVNQLHGLFQWAMKSRKGLLVFIDEAEAFLSTRSGKSSGSGYENSNGDSNSSSGGSSSNDDSNSNNNVHIRNALNALLYQTGTPSYKFMLVLATNRPGDLDSAVLDRIDVSISISPPQLQQRLSLIHLYMNYHLLQVVMKSQIKTWWILSFFTSTTMKRYIDDDCYSDETKETIAKLTIGFSGREIAKLFIAAQYAMYLAENSKLTKKILLKTVNLKVQEHILKSTGFTNINNGPDYNNDGDYDNKKKKYNFPLELDIPAVDQSISNGNSSINNSNGNNNNKSRVNTIVRKQTNGRKL
jgi:ATPase family AAA domain-containing protein 3A/B